MLRHIAAFSLCLSLAGASYAQNQPGKSSKPPKTPTKAKTPAKAEPPTTKAPEAQPGTGAAESLPPLVPVELANEPFKVGAVGLTMRLPAGAQTQTTGAGDATSTQVMGKDQSWLINIKTATTKTQRPADEVAREVRDQLLALSAPIEKSRDQTLKNGKSRARLLKDVAAFEVKTERPEESRPAANCYISIPRGEKETPIIRGYTVFEVSKGRYITFDLAVPEPNFAAARSAFEASLATARFTDLAASMAARGAAVERGMELLNKIGPAELDAACVAMKDQWFRLYRPGENGEEQEIAYRHVRAWKGKRGELDTARDTKRWTVEDHQEGYLVRIDARVLDAGKVFDTVGTYFMSPDRREEAWLLQLVIRDPSSRKPSTWREIGARSGSSMSVSTEGSGDSAASQPSLPDQGYLNQVEAYLLPQLLIQNHFPAGEYGFYSYQSGNNTGAVRFRRDVLGTSADAAWTITTWLKEDADPQASSFGPSSALVRTRLANGNVWVPIQLNALAELWKSKHLPMD